MNFEAQIVIDPDHADRWCVVVDHPGPGWPVAGSFASPGSAVDALDKWANGRGLRLAMFTVGVQTKPTSGSTEAETDR